MSLIINKDSRYPLLGGGIITFLGLAAAVLIREINSYEAKQFMNSSQSNINMLCNTIILASATILALLFTVLGLSSGTEIKLKKAFYRRIKQVALFDTICFVMTMIVFLSLNFPIEKSGDVPTFYYKAIYYATAIAASIIGGMMVTVILLLYNTISDLIHILGYGSKHRMADLQEKEEKEEQEQ